MSHSVAIDQSKLSNKELLSNCLEQLTVFPLGTFGYRVGACVTDLQFLIRYNCKNGVAHKVAVTMDNVLETLDDSFSSYLGWENYHRLW